MYMYMCNIMYMCIVTYMYMKLINLSLLQIHSSDSRAPERDSQPLPAQSSTKDHQHQEAHIINVASRLPTQQSNAAVVGQARHERGEVRGSRQQQQHHHHHHQLLDQQQPRKAGPSRGLIEEFLPPAQVVSMRVHI